LGRLGAALVSVCLLLAGQEVRAGRVFLMGVDGAGWSVIDPMLAEGALPNFAALARDGVTANLETVEPLNSPTVWTSIATGRSPDVHTIKDFFATALDRPVETVFERLAAQGYRVGLYEYLKTWPPRPLPGGFVIPGWTRRDDAITPADAFARAGLASPFVYSLDGLRNRIDFLENSRSELRHKARQWNELVRAFDLQAGAVTFYAVDALGHRFWLDSFPEQFEDAPRAAEPAHRNVIPEAVAGVDAALGEIRGALDPEDVLIVASDHGFQAGDPEGRVWTSSLDEPLAEQGLVPERDAFRFVSQFYVVLIRVQPGPFEARDALTDRLAALLREARSTNGDPLYSVDVLDAVERPADQRRPWTNRLRQWAVRTFARLMFDVEIKTDAHAYVLAWPDADVLDGLWPKGRVVFAGRERPLSDVLFPDGFTGTHHETAVFLAAGGAIGARPDRAELSVLDLAPLVFYLAGAPIPDDLEGQLPEHLIEPEALALRPARTVDATILPTLPPLRAEAGGDEEALLERLKAMGYVQ
jgi:predicted AlkP superfamily phosphohydrolase/phosphomutase